MQFRQFMSKGLKKKEKLILGLGSLPMITNGGTPPFAQFALMLFPSKISTFPLCVMLMMTREDFIKDVITRNTLSAEMLCFAHSL